MKVDEYCFRGITPDQREFNDQVTIILNYGKYSAQVITSEPQWTARNGEFVFYQNSTGNRVYFYANNQWNWFGGGAGGAYAAGQEPMVQFNSGGYFAADSGLQYLANTSLLMKSGISTVYNSDTGANTKIVYNNSSAYLEVYFDGELRLQM